MNLIVIGRSSLATRRGGFTLIEVLVGLAVLAIVSGALVALQVGSLRAARSANDTRAMAAVAQHQLGLARLLPDLSACVDLDQWPAVASCEVQSSCLSASCVPRRIEVRVVSTAGRHGSWQTLVDDALESAPFGEGVRAAEVEDETAAAKTTETPEVQADGVSAP